jgi:hypothetical protein
MKKQKLNEILGLSTEETLNRLLSLGRITHQYKQTHGEKLPLKHLDAALRANSQPAKEKTHDLGIPHGR